MNSDSNQNSNLKADIEIFSADNLLKDLFDKIPDMICIVNEEREVVFSNKYFQEFVGVDHEESTLGLKLGHVLNCENHYDVNNGCGFSDKCPVCELFVSSLLGLNGKSHKAEATITRKGSQLSYDLIATTSPIYRENKKYILYSLIDNSDIKRKKILERIFFHDIQNTATSISSISELLNLELPDDYNEYKVLLEKASIRLMEEISSQRQLIAAENEELKVIREAVTTKEVIDSVLEKTEEVASIFGAKIDVVPNIQNINFVTDHSLLVKSLSNLLINAIEAEDKDSTITLGVNRNHNSIVFYVCNKSTIEPNAFHNIFKRNYSTKGEGRGMGTYIVRLFVEKYLRGRVYFTSTEKDGTYFYIELPNR